MNSKGALFYILGLVTGGVLTAIIFDKKVDEISDSRYVDGIIHGVLMERELNKKS